MSDPSSASYAEAVAAFHRGIAAVQVGETGVAHASFERLLELAPDEPAAWANLALVSLQRRDLEGAEQHIERARLLAPDDARIELLSALIARERGQLDVASERLRRAVALDSTELRALFLLAQMSEPDDREEALRILNRILARQPTNRAAQLEAARVAGAIGDAPALHDALDRLARSIDDAPPDALAELGEVRAAMASDNPSQAVTQLVFLDATLQQMPAYMEDRDALHFQAGYTDLLLPRFLELPQPVLHAAAPDLETTFTPQPLVAGQGPANWVRAVWLSEDVPFAVMAARPAGLWIGTETDWSQTLAFPGSNGQPASAVAAFDYDYDFRVDLALTGPDGLRIYRQDDAGSFSDVTATAVPRALAGNPYTGVWAADLDMEGDLDLVLGSEAGTTALRNLGDGRFEAWPLFEEVRSLRDFVWADLDGDGTPDAALLAGTGALHLYLNRRSDSPRFQPAALPGDLAPVLAMAAADVDRDGRVDLALLLADGRVVLLSLAEQAWRVEVMAEARDLVGDADTGTGARVFTADLDNNGQLDLVVSTTAGTRVWLNGEDGLRPGPAVEPHVTDVADLSGDGRLDLLGLDDGALVWLENVGSRDYFAVTLQPRASGDGGDRRVNPFGTGGEIEIRAALLYQKQPIQSPVVHFGLGEHTRADVARIVWPNGSVQAEFNVSALNRAMVARQRLKGSCPWVFAFDGERMGFVTDFLWRTALGLRINAQGDAAVIHSEDWIRISGDQLVERDGYYDIRITGELWESHFIDHVSLMAVEHPAGTEVFVDERFTLPAPEPVVRAFGPLNAIAGARDHEGRDVTDVLLARDDRYLDTFALGPYQGVAEDHYVELDLGGRAEADASLWLIAQGWVYPTDSSINLAIGQAGNGVPRGLQVEVPDGRGGWKILHPDIGFPAGKTKTVLIDLSGAFTHGSPRHVRLRTNMEIYWDRITWSEMRPEAGVRAQRLFPAVAELRYRGFSEVRQASRRAPELPDYERIGAVAPQWLDLVGYHTRFGDVEPLIRAVDDRYVIMNAGDELVLRFPALPPPADGWTRDYVLVGDGWVKDGDFNTGFSRTVLPLPYHGLEDYSRAPGRLQDDPAYRRHPGDWQVYHTRFVTPHGFQRALVTDPRD